MSSLLKQDKNISSKEEQCEKILEKITECLLSKENQKENFQLFCECQTMEKIITLTKYNLKNINIIIIKNFGLLLTSIHNKKILKYFFSNDYMNQIILNIGASNEERDIDFLSYYINFLKTIANKLDINTLSIFFTIKNNSFPLLDEASLFFMFNDIMIKNTSRNIFLSLIKLNYEPMIQYICDIPRITDLLLLSDNIKSYIIYLTSINLDNNNTNISDIESKIKEVEENLIDDILFIQDILSIGILKINYILINSLFSIPFQYLFKNILTHNKISVSFYILNLILKYIKNECINNLIAFVMYSSQINNKIIEFILNQENQEIYNILYLNKLISRHSGSINLLFEEYIILVFNQNFLKSMRYIKTEEKDYEEIKDISNYIKERNDDTINDIKIGIEIISEILGKKNKLTQVIKKMELYHNLITRYTGINIGISHYESSSSFLKIIYDNLLLYNNDAKINIILNDIKENLIKKECLSIFDNYSNENQYIIINQLILILQIINSNKISSELKKFLCLNKSIQNPNSDESSEKVKHNFDFDTKLILQNLKIKKGIGDISEFDKNFSISEKKRNDIIKDFFGISETKTDYDMLNNYFNNSFYEDNNSKNISIELIPKPFKNDINDNIINFKNFNFNNKNLNKLLLNYNTKKAEEKNDVNLKDHDELLEKIVNITFKNEFLNKLNYRLSFELIENLILGEDNIIFYKDKYKDIFIKNYTEILKEIDIILLKSNSTKTKIYKFAYQYFEESFILNKNRFQILLNECLVNYFSFLLLNIHIDKGNFEIIDCPNKEHENLQCLFQKLIGICDLINALGFNFGNNKIKYLFRNVEFPLQLINSYYDKGRIININELNTKVNPVPVLYKTKDLKPENLFIFNYHNYLFIVSPLNKKGEINNSFLIENRLPLRQVLVFADRGEPRTLYLLNKNEIETTLFFDGVQQATKMKDNINNSIKLANLKEYSEVKKFIIYLMEN